ncbi:hypothetical protein [Arsukibacterium indicum]|uniref:DNA polymerase III subunit psi n=1 Tax=Arsukibacterium indicum TaxID=2848612 RepID=A0ABS6MJ96_9GAMM|nr:hypothetical protein [Arsukibacterium indicum]MBV2128883.1 hypothetical protein [Arsukibacterium indicum]
MKISASQAQLLRQLNIKPLQSRSVFTPESIAQHNDLTSEHAKLLQPEDTILSRDIRKLLSETLISDWLLDPAGSDCAVAENGNLLITPVLTSLQNPKAKKQLWALLQQQLADDAD